MFHLFPARPAIPYQDSEEGESTTDWDGQEIGLDWGKKVVDCVADATFLPEGSRK